MAENKKFFFLQLNKFIHSFRNEKGNMQMVIENDSLIMN